MKKWIFIILIFLTSITYADTVSERIYGSLTIDTDLTVDTNTLTTDATNNRVGVLRSSPLSSLDIGGSQSVEIETITTDTTLDETHYLVLVDTTTGTKK